MIPPRLPDWERRLSDYIASVMDRPFAWGEHDCILHACAAVDAMTGYDPAAAYRGQYDNRAGSADILKRLGKGTLLHTVRAEFTVPAQPGFARRGDLVWAHGAVGVAMGPFGLFVGEERLAEKTGAVMREGLIRVARREWARAWHV